LKYKYLFGPVPSRRLGLSLGIDLIPHKTCSLNCIYCECGKTTNLTIERKEYIPLDEIINELNTFLAEKQSLDYITFSGAGEPTLYNRLGDIVDFLKKNYPEYKTALLTNSSLLHDINIQNDIKNIDLILPSLDAVLDSSFKKINRPHKNLKIKKILNGLIKFSKLYKGKIWIEIFIIPGINDSEKELNLFKSVLEKINPDKIQLNSLDRPGTEISTKKATYDELNRVKNLLYPLPVDIIANFDSSTISLFEKSNIENRILSILERRPCTLDDLIKTSGLNINEVNKFIKLLIDKNKIIISKQQRGEFYKINK
jgi:wyosine [tRNA(Phe)-imidazoG37] synthetase (radical SAM superfamily)